MKYRLDFVTNSSSSSFGGALVESFLAILTAMGFSCSGDEKPTEPEYWIDTNITEGTLPTDGKSYLWFYSKVETKKPDTDTSGLTAAIDFSKGGNYGKLLKFIDYGYIDGYKCVCVAANSPTLLNTDEKTGSALVAGSVSTPIGVIRGSESICLELIGTNARIEMATMPEGNTELTLDDVNAVHLYAKVVIDDPEVGSKTDEKATADIEFGKGENGEWIKLNDVEPIEDWKIKEVYAVNPNGPPSIGEVVQPPASSTILLKAAIGEEKITANITFTINAKPELKIDKQRLNLLSKSGTEEVVNAKLLGGGADTWSLDIKTDSYADKVCIVTYEKGEEENSWVLTILENDTVDKESNSKGRYDKGAISLNLTSGEKTVEADIEVYVMREGLYIDPIGADTDGAYIIKGDGVDKKNLVFYLYTWDDTTKSLVPNLSEIQNLELAYKMTDDVLKQNVASVTELNLKYLNTYMEIGGVYEAYTVRPFPAKGEYVKFGLIMTGYMGDKTFPCEFNMKLKTPDTGVGSTSWEKEVEEITKIIDKIVPAEHRDRFYTLINDRKKYLSAEGLHVFRKDIIEEAKELNEKLAMGYLNDAAWYDKAIWWCEKFEIMGDIAIQALEIAFLGPLAGIGVDVVRGAVMSAYNAHVEGKTLEQWLEESMNGFLGLAANMGLGFVTDPSVIEEFIGKSPKAQAVAWGVFIGYNFINCLYNGMSVWEAAKHVGEVFAQRAAVQFLAGKVIETRCVINQERALNDLDNMVSHDSSGNPTLPPGVAEKAMMDPQFVRSIKNCPNERLKAAFENSMKTDVYQPHDEGLLNWIKSNVDGLADAEIKVQDFRTPKMDGTTESVNVNADRDYRVMAKDPATGEWYEVKKELWERESYEQFSKSSGFKEDSAYNKLGIDEATWKSMSHEAKTEAWARAFRQTPTDAAHIVSSRDFSDQMINPETGRPFTKIDINGNEVPCSNIELVKAGKSKLLDPQGMGEMYERKIFDEWQLNGSKSEGIEQIRKGFKELEAVRKGYADQGIKIESSSEYNAIKSQFESIPTDLTGKTKVDLTTSSEMNKALAHLANEFKKFPSLGKK